MKKCIPVLVLFGLLAALAFATEIPAPFGKVKEIALKATPDHRGNFMATFAINKNGEETVYLMGYLSQQKIIGIGTSRDGIIYEYNEESCECTAYVFAGLQVMRVKIDKQVAIDRSF